MKAEQIRKSFIDFFKKKGHAVVPSSSLLPDDPSVLLTTAGMQQFKRYFTGELNAKNDFGSLNTASVQKSFRTSDIEEIGDESHLTFFEMLGNFSFGGYFKKEAIQYAYEFITEEMNLEIEYVTVFDPDKVPEGDWRKNAVKFDKESYDFWKKYLPEEKIKREGIDNFWGPTGNEGPCGPTTEIYVNTISGSSVEVWNLVFNQFYRKQDFSLIPLKISGVDTGMGLERLAMVSQKVSNIFKTDLFGKILEKISLSIETEIRRIIADHIRAIVFLLSDGVRPSNKEAGYILRRLIRRVVAYTYRFNIGRPPEDLFDLIVQQYRSFEDYSNLDAEVVKKVYQAEYEKFIKTIELGFHEFYKKYPVLKVLDHKRGEAFEYHHIKRISGKDAFNLHQTYGLTIDILKDLAKDGGHFVDEKEFEREFKKHQEISRAGAEKKFGGHGLLLDTGELKARDEAELKKVTRLHTATHMLQAALRKVLGDEVKQMGSDITAERTRFDFTFPRKLTDEEKKKVEDLINQAIEKDLPVGFIELPIEEAKKTGALYFFKEKYPPKVKIYYVGHDLKTAFSKEFCGGPHVTHTLEIGKFKIAKEEAVGAGIRRIRGTID